MFLNGYIEAEEFLRTGMLLPVETRSAAPKIQVESTVCLGVAKV